MSSEKTVRYRFIASGADQVISAYRGITSAAQQATAADVSLRTRAQKSAPSSGISARQRAEEKWGATAEKSAAKAERAAKRASNVQVREHEKALKHVAKIKDRHFLDEQRKDERASRRHEALAQRRARNEAAARAQVRASRVDTAMSIGGAIKDKAVTAAVTGGMLAGGLIGGATRESFQTRELANRVSINAGLTGQKISREELQARFESVAGATPGMRSQDVAGAALEYQGKTGKVLDTGELQAMATAASAFGAEIKDIASAAAAVGKKFDIQGPAGISEALAIIGAQGAQGSFEIKDAAGQYDRLTAAAGSFGIGKGVGAVSRLGGFTQIAREATGSSEEAVTSIENVFTKLQDSGVQKRLKAAGVEMFDKEGRAKDLPSLLPEIIAKVGGKDIVKKKGELADLFDARGIRALRPLIQAYADATMSGKDGVKAMTDKISEASNTTDALARMNEAAAQAQTDSSAQLQSAWEALKTQTTDALTPALAELVPQLVTMVPAVQSIVEALGWLFEGLNKAIEAMQRAGLIDKSAEATKGVRGEGERKKMEKQIHELEANPARSQKQESELGRMREALRTSDVATPLMAAPKGVRSGFAGASDVPATPLTGADAIGNVMKMSDAEQKTPEIDTAPANKSVGEFAGALRDATPAIRKAAEAGQASITAGG